MNKFHRLLLIGALVTVTRPGIAQQIKLSADVKQALTKVSPDQIKADIAYLADDKLQGRLPGTPGFQMAIDYVVGRLQSLDVKPAGENGTWLQQVKLRRAFVKTPAITLDNGLPVISGTDYTISPNPVMPAVNFNAPLVFAGYGISEPALGYDDYAGLDVKGKVIVITRGSPDKFSSSVAAHTMNAAKILKEAAAHGAIGVIMANADSTLRMTAANRGVYSVLDKQGNVVVSRTYANKINMVAAFGYKLFNTLLKQSGKSMPALLAQLKAGTPVSFPLNTGIHASYTSTYIDVMGYNIIGKIEGSDPILKKQYIVHSAHLDHLGVSTPVEGDSIYNGAHDNASGVASLLGIATIYKNIKVKPKRSILTVFVTGEELGELGSGFFAKEPTVPIKDIVADVNTDMPTIIAPLLSVTALGAEHSSLSKQVAEAAGYLGLGVEDDPEPKQARFTRSDQYSFVLAGIPALHIKYGSKTVDGKNNMNDLVAPWRAKYYHKPQDDINGIFDFEAGKKYAQLNFLIGYLVAQDPIKPTWNKGDIFGTN
ncbi:M28 family peptidase [Mucilaginibacter sp.]|uniref:M28 family peptidase n=1 Tax=Mucilaginibacter sp. TaxID=1882438 RepID=UPI002608DC50|nr:M28 family peptidase [Mucilaginibacter sp.]MDB5031122.1 peptidase [Mucilaginibacter sp.]